MAHFYGKLQGSRGEATRCGSKSSNLTTYAAGWGGAIRTVVYYDDTTGFDMYRVELVPWKGSGGDVTTLAIGKLDSDAASRGDA